MIHDDRTNSPKIKILNGIPNTVIWFLYLIVLFYLYLFAGYMDAKKPPGTWVIRYPQKNDISMATKDPRDQLIWKKEKMLPSFAGTITSIRLNIRHKLLIYRNNTYYVHYVSKRQHNKLTGRSWMGVFPKGVWGVVVVIFSVETSSSCNACKILELKKTYHTLKCGLLTYSTNFFNLLTDIQKASVVTTLLIILFFV